MMTGSGLKAAIEGIFGTPIDDNKLQEFCDALINYIKANAEVPSGIAVQVDTGSGTGATTANGSVI